VPNPRFIGATTESTAMAHAANTLARVIPPAAINEQGHAALDDILGNISKTSPNKFGGLDYFGGVRGAGARYDAQGNFMWFLEP
jgi:hypothetical protein